MINADVYSEVYEILSHMNKSTVMKVPFEILELIKENRNIDYISKINKEDLFNLNNISKDTVNVLAWLDVNYWMSNEKKEKLKLQFKDDIRTSKVEEISNSENVKRENNKITTDKNQIKIYKEPIIYKIINKIREFINIYKYKL